MDISSKRWDKLPSQTPPQVTPLWFACWCKAWDSAILLLSRGADPNKAKWSGGYVLTPLYFAAMHGSTDVCRRLLESGARLDLGESTCLLFCRHHHWSSLISSAQLSVMSDSHKHRSNLRCSFNALLHPKLSYKNLGAYPRWHKKEFSQAKLALPHIPI